MESRPAEIARNRNADPIHTDKTDEPTLLPPRQLEDIGHPVSDPRPPASPTRATTMGGEPREGRPLRAVRREPEQPEEPLTPTERAKSPVANSAPTPEPPVRVTTPRTIKPASINAGGATPADGSRPPHDETPSVVRVTIRRVDVRANFTSTLPPDHRQPETRTPRLSLVDYLKARNGGER
jgi:hypothetical protein